MADEAFVQILAQRVVEKLLARQKQALVVYTGSNIGEAATLEAMGRLRGEGFTFRVLLSRGASGLLDVERLRSGAGEAVGGGSGGDSGGADRPVRHHFGSGHDGTYRRPRGRLHGGYTGVGRHPGRPDAGKERCGEHRRLLPGSRRAPEARLPYGGAAEAGASEQSGDLALLRRAPDHLRRPVGGVQARTAAPRKQEGAARIRLEGRVLSGRHVQGCPPHSTLWVPRETLITQLAADEARRRDICIRKET